MAHIIRTLADPGVPSIVVGNEVGNVSVLPTLATSLFSYGRNAYRCLIVRSRCYPCNPQLRVGRSHVRLRFIVASYDDGYKFSFVVRPSTFLLHLPQSQQQHQHQRFQLSLSLSHICACPSLPSSPLSSSSSARLQCKFAHHLRPMLSCLGSLDARTSISYSKDDNANARTMQGDGTLQCRRGCRESCD